MFQIHVTFHTVAHQGGWDEILMVAGPLLVFGGVLWLANKRANDKLAAAAASEGARDGSADDQALSAEVELDD